MKLRSIRSAMLLLAAISSQSCTRDEAAVAAPSTVPPIAAPAATATAAAPAPAPRPPPIVSPEVKADHSVTFRLKAPNAKEVLVRGQWSKDPVPMARDAAGVWSATTAPLAAGVWEYSLVVDGLAMIDPGNHAIKPMREPRTSILDLPATPAAPWDFQDVRHGTVHHHDYLSKTFAAPRQLVVYTPPGYEADHAVTYPLLVLQHGSGDDQDTWTVHGHAHWILDNLIASGQAQPMVVLMINGHQPQGWVAPGDDAAAKRVAALEAFRHELIDDALPLVEGLYRVERDPAHRAIAGLSMGGGQSLSIGLSSLDRFGWIGAFSAVPPDAEMVKATLADAAGTNAKLKLLYIAIGRDDGLRARLEKFVASLGERGITCQWRLTDGGHAWPVWRSYLADFAPRLFKP